MPTKTAEQIANEMDKKAAELVNLAAILRGYDSATLRIDFQTKKQ